jgi:hypothetical protein
MRAGHATPESRAHHAPTPAKHRRPSNIDTSNHTSTHRSSRGEASPRRWTLAPNTPIPRCSGPATFSFAAPPLAVQAGGQRTYRSLTARRCAARAVRPAECRARRARHLPTGCRCAAPVDPPRLSFTSGQPTLSFNRGHVDLHRKGHTVGTNQQRHIHPSRSTRIGDQRSDDATNQRQPAQHGGEGKLQLAHPDVGSIGIGAEYRVVRASAGCRRELVRVLVPAVPTWAACHSGSTSDAGAPAAGPLLGWSTSSAVQSMW